MLQIQIRRYAPQNIYYLQIQNSAYRQLTRRRKELEKKLVKEPLLEKQDELRAAITEVRREQVYCTEYVPLCTKDIPRGVHVRDMVRKPAKLVTVSDELYQWLLKRLPGSAKDPK